jgi:hypothetical protein
MISNIPAISSVSEAAATPAESKAAAPAQTPKQDTVHLSPQALAAATGDVDHDGDSH